MKKTKFNYPLSTFVKMLVLSFFVAFTMLSCDSQLDEELNQEASEQSLNSSDASDATMNSRSGYQGTVFNQAMTQTVANAVITFSKSDENYVNVTSSDASGSYQITLKAGTYYVTVTATGYNSYSSAPGYFV